LRKCYGKCYERARELKYARRSCLRRSDRSPQRWPQYVATRSIEPFRRLLLIEDFLRYGVKRSNENGCALDQGAEARLPAEEKKRQLAALETRMRTCTRCPLASSRTNIVFGQGVDSPLVLVIGEGPGAEEDRQGLPFVGASGQLLDKMLTSIGLSRETNCYIANIVKCRPPQNREPTIAEQEACIGYLHEQIAILKPHAILCMGRTAAHGLLGLSDPISRLRGHTYTFKDIPVRVSFHPSALLRDASLKRPAWEDLKQFRTLIASSITATSKGTD